MKYRIRYYRTRRGDSPVEDFIERLDSRSRAKVLARLDALEDYGLYLQRGIVEKVKGQGFYELRASKGKTANIRIFFCIYGDEIILLDAIHKRSRKLKREDLGAAIRRFRKIRVEHG